MKLRENVAGIAVGGRNGRESHRNGPRIDFGWKSDYVAENRKERGEGGIVTEYSAMTHAEKIEAAIEVLGGLVDTTENLLAASAMRLPPKIHIEALVGNLGDIRDAVKKLYFDLGGDDVWNMDEEPGDEP